MDSYAHNTIKENTTGNKKSAKKSRIIISVGSLLNGINEKGLSKDNRVKIKNFPGGTTWTILEEFEGLVKDMSDTLIVRPVLNNVKKKN